MGSYITNSYRTAESNPPPISNAYMFAMWFSGLRGGVAFALASVSFAHKDFNVACGGLTREQIRGHLDMCAGTTDSLAIMQTTLIIAAFTIFVFGGAITDLAIALDVLEKKGSKDGKKEEEKLEGVQLEVKEYLTLPPMKPGNGHGHDNGNSGNAATSTSKSAVPSTRGSKPQPQLPPLADELGRVGAPLLSTAVKTLSLGTLSTDSRSIVRPASSREASELV